jgi:hypothetical protein
MQLFRENLMSLSHFLLLRYVLHHIAQYGPSDAPPYILIGEFNDVLKVKKCRIFFEFGGP